MKRTSIVILFLVIALMILAFTACGDGNKQETETTTETTTELTTIAITAEATSATDEETEEPTTKAPETTKPKPTQKPTEAPKPTEKPTEKPTQPKPTEPKPTQPSGGLDTWDDGPAESGLYIQDPNENVDHWVDKEAEDLGENLDWELN